AEPLAPTAALPEGPPIPVWIVQRPRERYWLHALLLVLTIFTTLVVGARMQHNFDLNHSVFALDDNSLSWFPVSWIFEQPSRLFLGIPFSGTLMLILLAHEMGHYWMCKYYKVS